MKVTVLGIQGVDFPSRDTGEQVKGVKLHVKYKDSYVTGEAASNIFVRDNLGISCLSDIKPGMLIEVDYNSRGRVCDISICK